MTNIFVVIAGLIWGSFLSVVKNRIDDPKSIIIGRSKCPKCSHQLGFRDLFPVFSFILLRGKCRYCGKKISIYYLFFELGGVALAAITYNLFGLNAASVFLFLSLSFLFVASISDIEAQEVDIAIFIAGIIFSVIFSVLLGKNYLEIIFGAITFAIIPFTLYLISREKWMGLGDTFFALWAGVLVGFPLSLPTVFLAFFIGALFGIIKLSVNSSNSRIAFGPFLALAAFVGLIWSQQILDYYFNIFF